MVRQAKLQNEDFEIRKVHQAGVTKEFQLNLKSYLHIGDQLICRDPAFG